MVKRRANKAQVEERRQVVMNLYLNGYAKEEIYQGVSEWIEENNQPKVGKKMIDRDLTVVLGKIKKSFQESDEEFIKKHIFMYYDIARRAADTDEGAFDYKAKISALNAIEKLKGFHKQGAQVVVQNNDIQLPELSVDELKAMIEKLGDEEGTDS